MADQCYDHGFRSYKAAPNAPMTRETPLNGSDSQVGDVKGLGKAAADDCPDHDEQMTFVNPTVMFKAADICECGLPRSEHHLYMKPWHIFKAKGGE
jgi:hypothetical protein